MARMLRSNHLAVARTNAQPSLQIVLISRFLINLRRTQQAAVAPSGPSGIRTSVFHMPTIPDIVEDMGQPLQHGPSDHDASVEGPTLGTSFIQGSSASNNHANV